jgi:hypothetical protein
MTFRLKTSAESQSGFVSAISCFGTSNSTMTLPPADWIFFLRKSRHSPSKTFSVIGQSRGEICRDPSVLEPLFCPAERHSEFGRQELQAMAGEPEPSLTPLPTSEGPRGSLYSPNWRSLSRAWSPDLWNRHVGLDWHAFRVRQTHARRVATVPNTDWKISLYLSLISNGYYCDAVHHCGSVAIVHRASAAPLAITSLGRDADFRS